MKPKLLSGGNPQIAMGEGDAPVQAYIKAMPGWKRAVGRRIDRLIERTVPGVRKAIKWNSPFYGVDGEGWFLSYHCFDRYIKIGFFRGTSLRPMPPGASKHKQMRYLDIHEGELDEKQLATWVTQAASIPGEIMSKSDTAKSTDAADRISKRIAELDDWRGEALGRVRTLIKQALPKVVEEWKWENPVWSDGGIICTGESYKKAVKLTFPKGAALKDPKGLFNSSLEGAVRRAIDIGEGEAIDAAAFKALVKEAAALNKKK